VCLKSPNVQNVASYQGFPCCRPVDPCWRAPNVQRHRGGSQGSNAPMDYDLEGHDRWCRSFHRRQRDLAHGRPRTPRGSASVRLPQDAHQAIPMGLLELRLAGQRVQGEGPRRQAGSCVGRINTRGFCARQVGSVSTHILIARPCSSFSHVVGRCMTSSKWWLLLVSVSTMCAGVGLVYLVTM
uniref:Uncharacterized protein n=1 Tax=Globisporangium ultimum (strain ATCC 200006 / CBS 805.95 / DAOM BR144) TaxID=431595 RepID=K3WU37_GLOUD